jgi:hypothetical protein
MMRGKHHDVWKQFALDVGGRHIEGAFGSQEEVHFGAYGYDAVLEADVMMVMVGKVLVPVLTTRFVAELPAVPEYRFSMSAAGFGSAIARWFGAQDIPVGDAIFDEAVVLKGVDPTFVQHLFADAALRALCLKSAAADLQRRDDKQFWSDPTPGKDPLSLSVPGFVDDPEALRGHFDLFCAMLARQPEVTATRG